MRRSTTLSPSSLSDSSIVVLNLSTSLATLITLSSRWLLFCSPFVVLLLHLYPPSISHSLSWQLLISDPHFLASEKLCLFSHLIWDPHLGAQPTSGRSHTALSMSGWMFCVWDNEDVQRMTSGGRRSESSMSLPLDVYTHSETGHVPHISMGWVFLSTHLYKYCLPIATGWTVSEWCRKLLIVGCLVGPLKRHLWTHSVFSESTSCNTSHRNISWASTLWPLRFRQCRGVTVSQSSTGSMASHTFCAASHCWSTMKGCRRSLLGLCFLSI